MDKNLDLRALFQLPVRQIIFPASDQTGSASIVNDSSLPPMTYTPVKLRKMMGQRFEEEGETLGLDYVDGLECVEPDYEFSPSILTDLIENECELLLVVAMYNEGVEQFKNTLRGISNNLRTFVKYGIHPKKIACCLIVDGIKPFLNTLTGTANRGTKRFFSQFFDEDMINTRFDVSSCVDCKIPNEQPFDELAHIFMQNVVMDEEGLFPLQFLFTLKQKNMRKLNTHLWFFGGYCEMIQPTFVMLVDVGTKPLKNSLFHLYEAMLLEPNLAGCCGEIKPMNPNIWKLVIPAQEVEYKFSHIFDKALESVIGYITVLPGAFSAYRWKALQGSPLWTDYFKSICHPEEMSPFNSNIYLAEDRVLCLSLVSKKGAAYSLRYVRSSVAETDVPETIAELMSQRRRWINGSWFALIDSLRNFKKIFASDHTSCKKMLFSAQMVYYYISVFFSWFMVGSFYVVFAITIQNKWGWNFGDFGALLILFYVALLLIVYTLALSIKPKRANDLYKGIAVVFGLYMLLGFYLTFEYLIDGIGEDDTDWARYSILITFGMFLGNIVANCCIAIVGRGLFHFLFMVPTYVNVFLVYAICNTHDCTWGNRPDQRTSEENLRIEEFEEFRSRWTIVWALSNASFGIILVRLDSQDDGSGWYIFAIALIGIFIIALRTLGGFLYLCQEKCAKKGLKKLKENNLYRQFEAEGMNRRAKSVVVPETSFNNQKQRKFSSIQHLSSISDSDNSSLIDSENLEQTDFDKESEFFSSDSDFVYNLRNVREEMGLSISFLAHELDISSSKLRGIEEGEIEPNSEEKERILNVFKVNASND